MYTSSRAQTKHIGTKAFRQQCERYLAIIDDSTIIETYVKMFSQQNESETLITPLGLKSLFLTCFHLVMAHYAPAAAAPSANTTDCGGGGESAAALPCPMVI